MCLPIYVNNFYLDCIVIVYTFAIQTLFMTDLELMDKFIEECRDFISPLLLRDIEARGLYNYINFLPSNINEAKSVLRARLAKAGKFYNDEEIDQVAGEIKRLEFLRIKLVGTNIADAHKTQPILKEMQEINTFLLDYYKPIKI
jgi:hypothetical protein